MTIKNDRLDLFNIPNIITPNGDGFNDKWKIPGLEKYPNSKILIFDKQGSKLLDVVAGRKFEWDGTYMSKPLANGIYWYVIVFENGEEVKGYLMIKK